MTDKDRLLKIDTYEEYLKQRETFGNLKPDKEVIEHLSTIFPPISNPQEELYKTPPKPGNRDIGR